MATVTAERITQVYDDLTKTVNKTTGHSTYSAEKQNGLLAQSCGEACELLKDWLASDIWNGTRPSGDGPIAEFVQDQEHFILLLPTLKDVLDRASRYGMSVPTECVDQAREALKASARRHQQLYQDAEAAVSALKNEVCELAIQLVDRSATHEKRAETRKRAGSLLKTVSALLPALVIAMAGVTPSQAVHNLTLWDRELIKVIAIQDIVDRAKLLPSQAAPMGLQPVAPSTFPLPPRIGFPRTPSPPPHPTPGPRTRLNPVKPPQPSPPRPTAPPVKPPRPGPGGPRIGGPG
jgi:hypothetical protein